MRFSAFVVILMSLRLSAHPAVCDAPKPTHYLVESSHQIHTQYERLKFQANPRDFCRTNLLGRYLSANFKNENFEAMSDAEISRRALSEVNKSPEAGFGSFVSLPFLEEKKKMFAHNVILRADKPSNLNHENKFETALSEAETMINHPDPCNLQSKTDGFDLKIIEKEKPMSSVFDEGLILSIGKTLGFPYVCSELAGAVRAPDCAIAMDRMMSETTQKGVYLSQVPLLNRVLNSGLYDEGVKRAANKIISHLKNTEGPRADLYTDIKSSFIESGFEETQAEQLCFDVLGLLATGGAAMRHG